MKQKNVDNVLTWPVNAQDRFEYPLKYIIHVLVFFAQALDADILQKAVRLSLDAEPILGCRFVEDEKQPYWQRCDDLDEMQWLVCISTDHKDEAIDCFLKSPFFHAGQQINVCLVQAEGGDSLCVKISHACSDAGGLKEYLELLAGIYSGLQKNPDFSPQPHTHHRRDQKHYFDARGITDPLALFDPQAQPLPPAWGFPHHGTERKEMHMALRRFKGGAFDRIMSFAKEHHVTMTAVLLTAMFRSMFAMLKAPLGEKMGITVSVDLRHAFAEHADQAISNLVVGINPRISRLEEESFPETLKRASEALEELKQNRAETVDAIGLEAWGTTDYSVFLEQLQAIVQMAAETGKTNPLLSNVGVIRPLEFGQSRATDAYMLTPVVIPPAFMLGVTTFNRTMTLQCSFGEPGHRKEEVEAFMDLMEKELRSV